jgi:hypothetical protein
MHDIEPYYQWRDNYIASEDQYSPFYQQEYNEFQFTNAIYNYYIHPQWDFIGSGTLYMKIIFTDYDLGYTIFEMIGEWNDCVTDDIMYLKRNIVDHMLPYGIQKFIVIWENVLNFHAGDEDYYQEWYEDLIEEGGYIAFVNMLDHVLDEMRPTRIRDYVNFGGPLNEIVWRGGKPSRLLNQVEFAIENSTKELPGW